MIHRAMAARAALVVACLAPAAAWSASADLVLRGGAVHTMDATRTRAQSIAIDDGRIAAVGTDAEIAPWIGPDTKVIDLGGRMVLPGFHDSHAHPVSGGMRALSCNLVDARTIDAILATVRACAARQPTDAQGWLIGAGWDLSLFPAANPHRSMLDEVVPDRPVFLEGADGHSAWVNSKALAIAGVDSTTPDPPNGVIERDRERRAQRHAARERGRAGLEQAARSPRPRTTARGCGTRCDRRRASASPR